jgi:hypothetical protein
LISSGEARVSSSSRRPGVLGFWRFPSRWALRAAGTGPRITSPGHPGHSLTSRPSRGVCWQPQRPENSVGSFPKWQSPGLSSTVIQATPNSHGWTGWTHFFSTWKWLHNQVQ